MVWIFDKKLLTSHSFDFRKEINHNICSSRNAYQSIRNSFLIDLCTRHRTSFQNVYLNICAHARHSVSVMGHTQYLELSVPVLYADFFLLWDIQNMLERKKNNGLMFVDLVTPNTLEIAKWWE